MSRSCSAVAGFTWVAAHRVIAEMIRSRALPIAISEPSQSSYSTALHRRNKRWPGNG